MATRHSPADRFAFVARWSVSLLYLISPVLALLDWKYDLNLRLPDVLDRPGFSIGYYALMTAFGVLMLIVPRAATVLAVMESALNLLLNAAGLMLWYVGTIETAMTGPRGPSSNDASADSFNLPGFFISLLTIFACYVISQIGGKPREKVK